MRSVKLIAVDMDGTLLNSEGKVSARTARALRAAEAAGIEVVVATGRRHSYAMQSLRGLGLCESNALISSNGTVTRTLGAELLDRTLMPLATARRLCERLGPFRNSLVLTFDLVGADGDDRKGAMVVERMDELNASIGRWMKANERYISRVEQIELALEGDSPIQAPIQAMLCGTVERMRQAERLLGEMVASGDIAVHRTEYAERDLSIVDILPAGCSKGTALLRLATQRGVDVAQIMAIGDNWNDVAMLEVAGRPMVMGNAPPGLLLMAKERGWETTGGHDDDGAAMGIEAACLGRTEL